MQKTETFKVRVSPETLFILDNKVQKLQTNRSEYVRRLILEQPIRVRYAPDEKTEALKMELATVGRNLWQLIKHREAFKLKDHIEILEIKEQLVGVIHKINRYYDSQNKEL